MANQKKVHFVVPSSIPMRSTPLRVILLPTTRKWLARINEQTGRMAGWKLEVIPELDEISVLVKQRFNVFAILEADREKLHHQLQWVRTLTVANRRSVERQFAVAIVGPGILGHDESTIDSQDSRVEGVNASEPGLGSSSRQIADQPGRILEISFRAAGAIHFCHDQNGVIELIRVINRFARQLPGEPISFQEYVFENLPWQGAARQASE